MEKKTKKRKREGRKRSVNGLRAGPARPRDYRGKGLVAPGEA